MELVLFPGLGMVGGWMLAGNGDGFPYRSGGFSVGIPLFRLLSRAVVCLMYEGLVVGAVLCLFVPLVWVERNS